MVLFYPFFVCGKWNPLKKPLFTSVALKNCKWFVIVYERYYVGYQPYTDLCTADAGMGLGLCKKAG